jgi:hypothetical protein
MDERKGNAYTNCNCCVASTTWLLKTALKYRAFAGAGGLPDDGPQVGVGAVEEIAGVYTKLPLQTKP